MFVWSCGIKDFTVFVLTILDKICMIRSNSWYRLYQKKSDTKNHCPEMLFNSKQNIRINLSQDQTCFRINKFLKDRIQFNSEVILRRIFIHLWDGIIVRGLMHCKLGHQSNQFISYIFFFLFYSLLSAIITKNKIRLNFQDKELPYHNVSTLCLIPSSDAI